MGAFRRVVDIIAPPPQTHDDGRDAWPSRMSFILAAMGGAIGLGNVLRYPSQVYNNYGAQWFIPYFMAIFLVAIPVLILEISIGQAYRGGSVVAYNQMGKRLKGIGLGLIFNGYTVIVYYVPILGWVMNYWRNGFKSPVPWEGRNEEFWMQDVVANVDPVVGDNGWISYPGRGMVGETVGWVAFAWFLVWLCIWRGVGTTGRVVYLTMGLPIVLIIILIGRGASLPNAWDGIRLYIGSWHSSKLSSGQIWTSALGQVFFSTGVGFGYFTAYASYQHKLANAVQDSVIICMSNSAFEVFAAFAVFGVIGFLGMHPDDTDALGSFTVAFLAYPEAIAQMPVSQLWSFFFFLILMFLGMSSAFAMTDAVNTLIMDLPIGKKIGRPWIVTGVCLVSFLLSLMFCSEFGYYLLDGVDRWINDTALIFVVMAECIASTTIYRYKEVIGQVGWPAWIVYQAGYFGGIILGVIVGHTVSEPAGAGVGFGVYVACTVVFLFISKTPDCDASSSWNKNAFARKFWWVAFYSGEQLRRDLNAIVGTGKNWKIPSFWGVLLRYVNGPLLAIVYSFSYPAFSRDGSKNPTHIFGFTIAHMTLLVVALGFIVPRWFNILIPAERREDGNKLFAPNVTLVQDGLDSHSMESGEGLGSESLESKERRMSGGAVLDSDVPGVGPNKRERDTHGL